MIFNCSFICYIMTLRRFAFDQLIKLISGLFASLNYRTRASFSVKQPSTRVKLNTNTSDIYANLNDYAVNPMSPIKSNKRVRSVTISMSTLLFAIGLNYLQPHLSLISSSANNGLCLNKPSIFLALLSILSTTCFSVWVLLKQ